MAVVVYRSTDASAPVLTGQVGSLVAVLAGVLVTGYGTQPAAGWTEPFTGTGGGVFKQGGGCGFYLTVNDNGPGVGTFKEARIFPSETCSAYDAAAATTTNRFPTSVQAQLVVRKSQTADATARPWIIFADNKTLYMFIKTGDSAVTYLAWMFGNFTSYLAGDAFNCIVSARTTENSATLTVDSLDTFAILGSGVTGWYHARAFTGTGGSVNSGLSGSRLNNTASPTTLQASAFIYPNPPDGAIYLGKMIVGDLIAGVPAIRGELRGFWQFMHAASFVIDGDTFVATSGTLNGKSFLVIKNGGNAGDDYLMETSNTWAA